MGMERSVLPEISERGRALAEKAYALFNATEDRNAAAVMGSILSILDEETDLAPEERKVLMEEMYRFFGDKQWWSPQRELPLSS